MADTVELMVIDLQVLRRSIRQARQRLSGADQQAAASAVAERLAAAGLLKPSGAVAATFPDDDGELSPLPALDRCLGASARTCFPAIEEDRLVFRFVNLACPGDREVGPYGISQPKPSCEQADLASLDVVLVPLVAFDAVGHRVGRGRGYYDRALAPAAQNRSVGAPPLLIGLAHDLQQVPRLEPAPHDVPLDLVITPGGYHGPLAAQLRSSRSD